MTFDRSLPNLSLAGKNMLDALFDEAENAADEYANKPGRLRTVLLHRLKAEHGIGNRGSEHSLRFHYGWANPAERALLVEELWEALKNVDALSSGRPEAVLSRRRVVSPAAFEERVNRILEREGSPLRLQEGRFVQAEEEAALALLRDVLSGIDEVARHKDGDVQEHNVVSTVQPLLTPGAVVVDYGAGYGRVAVELARAALFKDARYIGVDSPIDERLLEVVGKLGPNASVMAREEFLESSDSVDVVMVVNTLHHMPFAELGRDFARLLRRLQTGGRLVLHDMSNVVEPGRVPWTHADLEMLFFEVAGVHLNQRSTPTRTQVPLLHTIVQVNPPFQRDLRARLDRNARLVWQEMKTRALVRYREMLSAKQVDTTRELVKVLLWNANLDINPPPTD